jgi:ATP-dependent Lon protease
MSKLYEYDPDYVPDDSSDDSEDEYEEYDKEYNEDCYDDDDDDEENDEDEEYEDEENDDDGCTEYNECASECSSEEDEENHSKPKNIMFFINGPSNNNNPLLPIINSIMNEKQSKSRKRKSSNQNLENKHKKHRYDDIVKKYNKFERDHFNNIEETERDNIYALEKNLEKCSYVTNEPLRFKFLKLNISNTVKNIIISKLEQLNKMIPCSGEYFKLSTWMNILSKIPIGRYHTLPITNTDNDIANYLQNIKSTIDTNIFGHDETKEQIVRILAQWISNPQSNGYVIGIQGSPGVGKTKLIKEGICKAMNYPFSFISLGGISDASYLNGHHYTYEGATHGKIIECLIKAQVMNPVILFDELDKVSNTSRGDEIINTLIHITDPVQNDRFTDKYFEEIDLDLSKSLIIFTYNDENAINPILKDRMITIKVSGYNAKEKIIICKDYILPELLPQYNMQKGDVILEDSLLRNIIDIHGKEEGVRSLKRVINDILSCINMMKYIPTDDIKVTFPFCVDSNFYNKYCTKFEHKQRDIIWSMYT